MSQSATAPPLVKARVQVVRGFIIAMYRETVVQNEWLLAYAWYSKSVMGEERRGCLRLCLWGDGSCLFRILWGLWGSMVLAYGYK